MSNHPFSPSSPSYFPQINAQMLETSYSDDADENDVIVSNLGTAMKAWRDDENVVSCFSDLPLSVTDSVLGTVEKDTVTKTQLMNNGNFFGDSNKSSRLSLVSWNIWFDDFEYKLRYDYILQYIRFNKPHIVCLQEVTPRFINQLRIGYPDILSEYCFSDSNLDSATVIPYGVATLCRRELSPSFSFENFPSKMWRKLLVTEFTIDEVPFRIGTVHLESLNNQPTREEQLKVCSKLFEDKSGNYVSIICGDFNFCSYRNFDMPASRTPRLDNVCLAEILPDFVDLWPALHDVTVDMGITFDTTRNTMLSGLGHPLERMRYDRVIFRPSISNSIESADSSVASDPQPQSSWRPVSMEMIGVEAISAARMNGTVDSAVPSTPEAKMKALPPQAPGKRGNAGPVSVCPSDHFGLSMLVITDKNGDVHFIPFSRCSTSMIFQLARTPEPSYSYLPRKMQQLTPPAIDDTVHQIHLSKNKEEFRNYVNSSRHEIVQNHYNMMRQHQTYDFVQKMHEKYSFVQNKFRSRMTIREAFKILETYVDSSDPDVSLPNLIHMLQTAEGIRKDGHPDWFQLVGLIHDMGKIMFLWGDEHCGQKGTAEGPQWALGGDTWVVGAKIPDCVVFPEFNSLNPDMSHAIYSKQLGIYEPHCGIDNLYFAYGHDEYLYQMVVANKCTLPVEALAMIRYHSAYPWHTGGAYREFMTAQDEEMMKWVLTFNKYDLYTKSEFEDDFASIRDNLDDLWRYYEQIIGKYFPEQNLMW